MNYATLAIEAVVLLLLVLLGLYDWFYTQSVRRMTKQWGIIFPPLVTKLVNINRYLTIGVLLLLTLILFYTLFIFF